MFSLRKTQLIDAPVTEVFSFFERPENLEKITPTWLGFTILNTQPLDMGLSAEFDYTIKMFGLKLKWRSKITNYKPPYSFTDVQIVGPYKLWVHNHTFIEQGKRTLMTDIVEYKLYGGMFSSVLNKIFVKKKLEEIFSYRQEKIDLIFKQ